MLEYSPRMMNRFTLQVVLAQMEMWIELHTSCINQNNMRTTVTQHRINASVQLGKCNILKKMELYCRSLSWKH
jgi:hypothetical protein